jgi:hypothetical protein
MYHKHISEQHRPADGSTVADEVEGKLFIQVSINGIIGSNEPECIAIGRGAKDGSHADVSASANPVFYYDLLAQFLRKELADNPGDGVVGAARRE